MNQQNDFYIEEYQEWYRTAVPDKAALKEFMDRDIPSRSEEELKLFGQAYESYLKTR